MMFADRVVLVTGGGTGIGRALAAAFYREGAKVAIASRDPEHLKKAATVILAREKKGGELIPVRLDVRAQDSARAAAAQVGEEWGRIDVLINNAGVSGRNPLDGLESETDQRWLDIIATNLNGAYFMIRACVPRMPEGSRIINMSSVLGKFGVAGYSAYCAAKHGVVGLTRALAAELAPGKITVNAICPGWVDTAMSEAGIKEIAAAIDTTPEEFRKAAMEKVPLGRMIHPEEIAPLALYLASPAAEAITGQAINIEGGATTW